MLHQPTKNKDFTVYDKTIWYECNHTTSVRNIIGKVFLASL